MDEANQNGSTRPMAVPENSDGHAAGGIVELLLDEAASAAPSANGAESITEQRRKRYQNLTPWEEFLNQL